MTLILELRQEIPGVVVASSADPQHSFEVWRMDRNQWKSAPQEPGIYFLVSTPMGSPAKVYVGQSESGTTGIRGRIDKHRKDKKKEFFGEIFAFPLGDPAYCRAVEAELIKRATDAESKTEFISENTQKEAQWQGAINVQKSSISDSIQEALQMLLGRDIFSDESAVAPSDSSAQGKFQASARLLDLQEGGFLASPQPITSKDRESKGLVTEDGAVDFDGFIHTSLSSATMAAKKLKGQTGAENGWRWWFIERDGELVDLKTVRDEFLAANKLG